MSIHPDRAADLVRSAASSAGITMTPENEAKAAAHLAPLIARDPENRATR